jgi:hypothetical protein
MKAGKRPARRLKSRIPNAARAGTSLKKVLLTTENDIETITEDRSLPPSMLGGGSLHVLTKDSKKRGSGGARRDHKYSRFISECSRSRNLIF